MSVDADQLKGQGAADPGANSVPSAAVPESNQESASPTAAEVADGGRPGGRVAQRFWERRQKKVAELPPGPLPTVEQKAVDEAARHMEEFFSDNLESKPNAGPMLDITEVKPADPTKARGRALRRLLDENIDSELDDAMAGFAAAESTLIEPERGARRSAPVTASGESADRSAKRSLRVLSVRGGDIYLDLDGKSEGVVSALQFGKTLPIAGDFIDVILDHYDTNNDLYIFRRPGVAQEADWSSVEKGMVVDAIVKKVNKGGLEVSVNGIRAFMPAGQVDIDHIPDFSSLVGQSLRSIVSEVNIGSKNLIVSRRLLLERERAEKARETLANLAEGQVREGKVKRVVDFGAFVDIGGVDGLLPVSQMSWLRVKNPNEVLTPGQTVKVVVLKFEPDAKKITLGLKQLSQSPWELALQRLHVGGIYTGTVTRLAEFGAFVELEEGVEGLIHISELSQQRIRRVQDVVTPGQRVDVKLLDVDDERKRIALSLKQAAPEPEPEPTPEPTVSDTDAGDATAAAASPAPEPPPAPKKPAKPLKGGLGGGGGPLFGN